jgi:WD40 repeat protein
MADLTQKLIYSDEDGSSESKRVQGIRDVVERCRALPEIESTRMLLPSVVTCITSTVSSNFLAIGTETGETYILQPPSIVPTRLGTHSTSIKSLIFTQDTKYLIAAHENGLVVVWNYFLAKVVLEVQQGKEQFARMCVTNDGRYIIIGYKTGRITIWSIEDNNERHQLRNSIREITAMILTSDDKRLVAASDDYLIHVYIMQSFTLETVFRGHIDTISDLALTPDNLFLYSSSHDYTIKVWCLKNKKLKGVLTGHTNYALNVVLSSDCKYAISGASDGHIRVWNTANNKCEMVYKECDDWVRKISLVKDTSYFASACDDKSVIIWDMFSPKPVIVHRDHTDFVRALHVTADARYLISGSFDKSITLFEIKQVPPVTEFTGNKSEIVVFALTKDNKYLASASNDGEVVVYNFQEKTQLGRVKVKETFILALEFSKDGQTLVAGCEFGMIYIWSFPQLQVLASFEGHSNGVNCVALTKMQNYLITGSKDTSIILWSLENQVKVTDLKGHTSWVIDLKVSNNEDLLYSCSIDSTIIIWSLVTRSQVSVLKGHSEMVNQLFITNNSSYLLSSSDDHSVIFWDLRNRSLKSKLDGHSDKVVCVAASSDCKLAISGSLDRNVILWNLTEFREEARLGTFDSKVVCVEFTSDHKYCIAASEYKLMVWDTASYRLECEIQFDKSSIFGFKLVDENRYIAISSLNSVLIYDTLNYFMNLSYPNHPPDLVFLKTSYPFAIRSYLRQITLTNSAAPHPNYMNSVVISPTNSNILSIYSYLNLYTQLSQALKSGVDITQDINGMSPLTISILRNTRGCTDAILQHLIDLEEEGDARVFSYIQALNADIPNLIEHGSANLRSFIELLFKKSPQKDLPMFAIPRSSLPIIKHHDFRFISKDLYIKPSSDSGDQEILEFYSSYFNWNFTTGSHASLRFLNAVYECSDQSIHSTPLIKTLINYKWDSIYGYLLFLTFLYWGMLGIMLYLLYEPYQNDIVRYSFAGLNGFLMLYELIQGLSTGFSYFFDLWNAVDLLRGSVCLYWIYCKLYSPAEITVELTWGMAVLCWARGFTYFRTFKYTRYFIRMILDVMRDTVSFFLILIYTTLALGSLYYITRNEKNEIGIIKALRMSYELNLGQFDNDNVELLEWMCFFLASIINCIVMLNLLISILSDAFDRLQTKSEAANVFEMMHSIIEVETMMFWRRNAGSKLFLQKCGTATEIEQRDEWYGKIVAISRKIESLDQKLNYSLNRELIQRFDRLEELISQRVQQEISTQLQDMEERINASLNSILSK